MSRFLSRQLGPDGLIGLLSTCMQRRACLMTQSCDPLSQLPTLRHICPWPQESCQTFNYNNVRSCRDSLCYEQGCRVSVVLRTSSWWVRGNTAAQTPAELLVKMEALIRLCFSSVIETLIKAQANAQFTVIHLSGLAQAVRACFTRWSAKYLTNIHVCIYNSFNADPDNAPLRW